MIKKMIFIIFIIIFTLLLVKDVSGQLTKDESDKLDAIDEAVKRIETSTNVCEDIEKIVSKPSISVFGTEYQYIEDTSVISKIPKLLKDLLKELKIIEADIVKSIPNNYKYIFYFTTAHSAIVMLAISIKISF